MGKPTNTRHKNDNTFRFQGQKERQRSIIVNQLGSIRDWLRDEDEDEALSFLYKAMVRWQDLNLYAEFKDLLNEIGTEVKTLTQVLHQKEKIKDVLMSKIEIASSGYLNALFGLLVAFVSDIRQEFVEYLPATLSKITDLMLSTTDTDVLAECFDCYNKLVKDLKTTVTKDFSSYLKIFVRILGSKVKNYIVNNAAKSFSFVCSKVSKNNASLFCKKINRALENSRGDLENGLAQLLYYILTSDLVMKNSLSMYQLILYAKEIDGDSTKWESLIITLLGKLTASTKQSKNYQDFIPSLWQDVKKALIPELFTSNKFNYSILVLNTMFTTHDLRHNQSSTACISVQKEIANYLFANKTLYEDKPESRANVVKLVCSSLHLQLFDSVTRPLLESVVGTLDIDQLHDLDNYFQAHCSDYKMIIHIFGNEFRVLATSQAGAGASETVDQDQQPRYSLLHWLSDLIVTMNGGVEEPLCIKQYRSNRFTGASLPCYYFKNEIRERMRVGYNAGFTDILKANNFDFVLSAAKTPDVLLSDTDTYLRFFVVLQQIDLQQYPQLKTSIIELFNSILPHVNGKGEERFSAILYLILEAFGLSCDISEFRGSNIQDLADLLVDGSIFSDTAPNRVFSVWNLKMLDLLLYLVKRESSTEKRNELLTYFGIRPHDLIPKLRPNLVSGFKMVRTLTLSILHGLYTIGLTGSGSTEHIEKFLATALANEVCEFDLTSLDHLGNYLTLEGCIKHATSEDADGADQLVTMMEYILGTLFQNHTNIMQTCRDTLFPVIINKLKGKIFWNTFGSRFLALHKSQFEAPQSFVSSDAYAGFWEKVNFVTFGLLNSDPQNIGQEYKVDYARYKINMWIVVQKLGLSLPQNAQVDVLQSAYDLYKQVESKAPFIGVREDPQGKENISILAPAMEFINLYSGRHTIALNQRREIGLGILHGPKPIQKTAIAILRSISPTINDFLTKTEKIGEVNWLRTIHLKELSGPDAFFVPQDRPMFLKFILRLLLSLKAETKGDHINHVLQFLYNFSEEEVIEATNYLLGDQADWKITPRTPGALKYVKGHLKTINKMITEWRFKFPDVVTLLMERVCDFVLFAEEDFGDGLKSNSDEENKENNIETNKNENVVTKRRKAIINVGRLCILNFFNLFDKLPIHEDLIHRIFEAVIWRSTQSTVAPTGYSSDSISWLFQLMMTWSRLPRFHELFIKCKDQDSKTTLIHNLFEAFESKFLKPKPHVYAMEIVTNLGLQEPEEDFDVESAMENIQSEPIQCGESLQINIEEEQMGRKILHHFKDRLLTVITKTTFFEDQMFLGSKTQTYIDFLRLCAQFSVSADTNHKLCSTIIRIVPKFRNKHGELIGLYNLVEELLKSSKPKNNIAIELSHCLAWTCERGPREALCKAIRESMVNKNHASLIQELNSYNVKVADSPDFEKRQAAFLKCTELVRTSKGFKNVFFSLVTNNCFFYLRNEPDIGILSATEGLLTAVAEKIETIPKENESKAQIHTFLERVVVGRTRAGIRSKADDVFNLYLKTLSIFSGKCHEHHGALKGTHLIFQQNGKDLLLELQEMQLSAKAKATNQIQHLWSVMRTQPSTVVNFVIPIMSHHLLDKTKIKVALQNLVQCSCEALKWCAIALPHGAYFKYLENVMENIPDDDQLLKQYHKLLGYILDGYHFELDEKFVQSLTSYNGLKRFQKTEEVKPAVEDGEPKSKPDEENMDVEGIEEESSEPAVVVTGVDPDSPDSEGLVVKLNYAESKSLMKTIEERFIPKLRKYLHLEEKASHKLAKAGSDQDILVKKIPTTLAYVKLLHKLPQKVRKSHMLWVIPTLCSSLNSRLQSIRSNVRSTLMKIVEELGPEIFPEIVRYSKSYLARGYQKHVRNYTLVQILKQSKDAFSLKPNCVPVKDIVTIAEDELFGVMSEDKDVKEIVKNTPEAKGQNGLQLVFHSALFSSADSLDILLKCPIERAKSAKNLDTLKTAKSWMSEIANGLALNTRLSTEELLAFLWSQLELHGKDKSGEVNKASTESKYLEKPVDTFLLPSAKKQATKQGKLAVPTVVSWFAYSTLQNMLKRDTFQTNATTLALLDKFARAIVGGQNDESLEIRSPTVRNLILMYQLPLKCFLEADFVQKMWQKYFMAVNEAVSNEDINMYYKFLTSFCLTFTEYRMDRNDFSLLVKCLNKHLQDSKCTGSSLVLLRNILYRNLQSNDLTALIREVKRRICSDDSIHIQEGCRAAYLVYMKNYLKGQEEFMNELYDFFKTLGFRKSHQDTHSIYKMIGTLFTIIPDSWIPDIAVNVGMDLVLALMKSQDPNSQKLVCNFCMKNLFDRMGHTEGLSLLDELQTSAALPEMIPYQREICLSLNKMIEHKKCWDSEAVALKILAILSEILSPAADVAELQSKNPIVKTQHRELAVFEGIKAAHRALQTLISATKLENKVSKELQKILEWIRTAYLIYKHESIQDAAVQCLNLQLGIIVEIKELPIAKKLKNSDFMAPLYSSDNLKSLISDYVKIGGFFEAPEMRSNVLSGLVPLAKLAGYQESPTFHENLVKSLRATVNLEVRKSPQETKRRETVFTFCEQYVSFVPKECLTVVQRTLMTITTRERTDQNVQDLSKGTVQLCASIQKKLEERLGKQAFLKQYEESRGTLQDKRDNNRAKKKEQVVLHMDSVMGSVMRKRKRKPKDERIDGMNMDWAKKSKRIN